MGKLVDLSHQRFGRLHVQCRATQNIYGKPAWVCLCDCGATCTVAGSTLRMGEAASCGCLHKEVAAKTLRLAATKHGRHNSNAYLRWLAMKARCSNPNHPAYPAYGGRGVKVCEKWSRSFEAFLNDVGECPSSEHSLDRIDNDGDYEPTNVRWATRREQANNRRSNVRATINGVTKTYAAWARDLGITPEAVAYRIKNNKPLL